MWHKLLLHCHTTATSYVAPSNHCSPTGRVDRPFLLHPRYPLLSTPPSAKSNGSKPTKTRFKIELLPIYKALLETKLFFTPIAIKQLVKHEFRKFFFKKILELELLSLYCCTGYCFICPFLPLIAGTQWRNDVKLDTAALTEKSVGLHMCSLCTVLPLDGSSQVCRPEWNRQRRQDVKTEGTTILRSPQQQANNNLVLFGSKNVNRYLFITHE